MQTKLPTKTCFTWLEKSIIRGHSSYVFLRQFPALIGRSTTTKMILGTGQKYVIKQGYDDFSDQK